MKPFVRKLTKRRVRDAEDRAGYWLTKTPAERVEAVGIINLTVHGEHYAEQEFQRVCRVTRRTGR